MKFVGFNQLSVPTWFRGLLPSAVIMAIACGNLGQPLYVTILLIRVITQAYILRSAENAPGIYDSLFGGIFVNVISTSCLSASLSLLFRGIQGIR